MHFTLLRAATLTALAAAAPAFAQDMDFCADRPGLGTPTCTLQAGETVIEVTGLAIERHDDGDARTRVTTLADTLLRHGIGGDTEIQLGIMGHVEEVATDRLGGGETHASGIGDAFLALRHGLSGADGPVAIQAYVTLPTGAEGVGAGTWGAGLLVPVDLAELGPLSFALTPEISATPDEDGDDRHLTYGAVLGASAELARGWSAGLEISAFQDDEPGQAAFESQLAASVIWSASPNLQLNAEFDAGLAGELETAVRLGLALKL